MTLMRHVMRPAGPSAISSERVSAVRRFAPPTLGFQLPSPRWRSPIAATRACLPNANL